MGIIPRTIKSLYTQIRLANNLHKRKYSIHCSYLQIYQEKIYDLLNNYQFSTKGFQNHAQLKLRWNKQDDFIV